MESDHHIQALADFLSSNIWAPNQQTEISELIDKEYGFSKRLAAIIKTAPPKARKARGYGRSDSGLRKRMRDKDDMETGIKGETETTGDPIPPKKPRATATHYTIAQQMLHYHSIDAGKKCKQPHGRGRTHED